MRQLLKRRTRQFITLLMGPMRPVMGEGGRRWATRLVNPRGKLYIPPGLGVEGFFAALQDAGVRHAVLRWFEELPHVERGHDLDILVADDGIDAVRSLLSTWPRGTKIDYYSETGQKGTGYRPELLRDVPAFPGCVAGEILARAHPMPGGWMVPAPREHFLGLAFHAVYLKGRQSGLPFDIDQPATRSGSHDYAAVLKELAAAAGIAVELPVTARSLDEILRAEGWRPTPEHLAALAPANPWIGSLT